MVGRPTHGPWINIPQPLECSRGHLEQPHDQRSEAPGFRFSRWRVLALCLAWLAEVFSREIRSRRVQLRSRISVLRPRHGGPRSQPRTLHGLFALFLGLKSYAMPVLDLRELPFY